MSTTKLTLTISDAELLQEAKLYAKEQGRSLSSMVENYFKSLVPKEKPGEKGDDELTPFVKSRMGSNNNSVLSELPPVVKSLSGCVPLIDDKTDDELLWEALQEKYLK